MLYNGRIPKEILEDITPQSLNWILKTAPNMRKDPNAKDLHWGTDDKQTATLFTGVVIAIQDFEFRNRPDWTDFSDDE